MQIGKRWSDKQAKLVGKIILSNFLELSLDKFEKYIETIEKLPLFLKFKANGIVNNVSAAKTFTAKPIKPDFAKRYRVADTEKLLALSKNCSDQKNYQIHLLLCKLRHITTRNEFTHRILTGIIERQKNYFFTGNYFELKPLTQRDLFIQLRINEGWISRIAKGKLVITPQGKELPLKFFFHKRKDSKKRFVKQILSQERQDLKSGRMEQPGSDEKLRYKLESDYGISVSKRSIVPNGTNPCFFWQDISVC